MNDKIQVGIITKPQGLRGEMRVQIFGNDLQELLTCNYFYLGESQEKFVIQKSRSNGTMLIVSLQSIDTIEKAEALRNSKVFVDKTQLSSLEQNEYFIEDLLNCEVICEKNVIGKIIEVDNYGASYFLTVQSCDGKEILFPFLKDVIINVDVNGKQIEVLKSRFDEVKIDEN